MTQADEGRSILEAAERLLQASRYRAACSAFASLADVDGHRATANIGWGRALAGLENYDEAASRFDAAIDADPANQRAFTELSQIWDNLSQRDTMLARIQQRLDTTKASTAHAAWAAFLSNKGFHQRALAEYNRAARPRKRDADVLLQWGEAFVRAGLHEQALERFIDAIRAAAAAGRQDLDCFDSVFTSLQALGTPNQQLARIQACVDDVDDRQIRLRWAQTLLQLGRAGMCADQIKKTIQRPPNDAEALRIWGVALIALDDKKRAMLKFTRAIKLDPSNSAHYEAAAQLISELKPAETHIRRIQTIVDTAATAEAHDAWATTLVQLDPKLAVAQFEAAQRLSPTAVSATAWADALERLGRVSDAAIQLIRSLEKEDLWWRPAYWKLVEILRANRLNDSDKAMLHQEVDRINSAATYAAWGEALAELDRNADALALFDRAARRFPDDTRIALERARALARSDRRPDALEVLSRVFGRDENQDGAVLEQIESCLLHVSSPDLTSSVVTSVQAAVERLGRIDASLRWAQVLLKLGERAKAVAELERAAGLEPENATAQVELAKALIADGKFAEAADHSARAVAIGGGERTSLEAAINAFKAAFMHSESDRWIRAVDEAICTIDGANAYGVWGGVLGEIGRLGAQLVNGEKMCGKNPASAWTRAVYAYWLVQAGRSDEGLAEHARAAEREPGSEGVHRLWGLSLSRLRRYREALEQFQRAAELDGRAHYFEWALTLEGQGLKEAAIEKYHEHMRLREDDPVQLTYSLHNIACIREAQGNYTVAAYAWDTALQSYERTAADPGASVDSTFYAYMSFVLASVRRDFDAAEKWLAVGQRLNPSDSFVCEQIATLYLKRIENLAPDGRDAERAPLHHARAREAYARAKQILDRRLKDLAIAPELIQMGRLHFAFEDYDAAKTCLMKALELDKDSTEAWSLLNRTYLRSDELMSSLNCARAAASREPHSLDYCNGLAEVHLKLNELDKAESEYRKVLAVAPNHVDALLGLGKTYLAIGSDLQKAARSSDAESMFARALDQFWQATSVAGTKCGSKRLSPGESAALCYSCGYANVMRYESQTIAKRDQKLLDDAIAAFDQVPKGDANFHKAQRAKAKILEQRQVIDRSARWGAWIVVVVALLTLLVANVEFLVGKPGLTRTFQVTDQSVQLIKAVKAPEDVAARLEALSRRGGLTKAAFDAELSGALGDEWTKKVGDAMRWQARTELRPGWQESIEAGYYALLSFGALMFVVAGLYLQQLSKLKFGGFELEKTSEATTKVAGSLGITP